MKLCFGEFLKELHLTEGRNTGFQKIIRALKTNGSPMPVFETDEDRTYFVSTIFIHPSFLTSNEERNEELTDNEKIVLNTMQMDSTITIGQMESLLGLSKTTIERAIKSLKEKKKIRREGATKNGKWIVIK